MKIRISYPGQEERIVDAPAYIARALKEGRTLAYIEMLDDVPSGFGLEDTDLAKLRSVSAALNDPNASIDFDKRRDLANLIDYVCSGAVPLD